MMRRLLRQNTVFNFSNILAWENWRPFRLFLPFRGEGGGAEGIFVFFARGFPICETSVTGLATGHQPVFLGPVKKLTLGRRFAPAKRVNEPRRGSSSTWHKRCGRGRALEKWPARYV